ncbi:MAG: GtrA family protein [Candidatus Doudnabacteria bacterium]|nr:GtrA family protein [Candidatus Doudnabacteria bacterium]
MIPENNLPPSETNKNYGQLAGQFLRFAVVGLMNTVINFIILNVLTWLTGIEKGGQVIYISAAAFAVATTNSYYMNKHWSFRDPSTNDRGVEFTRFLMVSIVGAAINATVIFLVTTYINPVAGLSAKLWLNLANALGIGLGLIWNFFGYRRFVFKDR